MTVFEEDRASFHLKLYTADEELPLNNPTKTMSIVMGFVENNNQLLDQITTLQEDLSSKLRLEEEYSHLNHELRSELLQSQSHNRELEGALHNATRAVDVSQAEYTALQRQVGAMTSKLRQLSQENKLLRYRAKT